TEGISGDAGAGDASSKPDASVGIQPSACPATLPSQDGACTKNGLLCEYGDDFNPLCNTVFVCSSGRWAQPIYYSGRPTCPTNLPALPPSPSDCAATRAQVPVGQACSTKSSCAYDGSTCFCGVSCPNYPIRPPDCAPDAGKTTNCCDTT